MATLGPPLLFGLSRYTAEEGWRVILNGHNLKDVTRLEVGGVAVPLSDVTPLSQHRLAFVVPRGAQSGTIFLATPRGSDLSKFVLRVEPVGRAGGAGRAPSGSPPPVGRGGPLGSSPTPYDDDFDFVGAIGAIGAMAPPSMRASLRGVGNVVGAIQSAYTGRPFAAGGDWLGYSANRGAYSQWRRAQSNAPRLRAMYESRLAAVTSDPSKVDFDKLSDSQIAALVDRAKGHGLDLSYEKGVGWSQTNAVGQKVRLTGGARLDALRQSAADDVADASRAHLQNRISQVDAGVAMRGKAALASAAGGGALGFGVGKSLGTSGVLSGIGGVVGTAFGPVGTVVGSVVGLLVEKTVGLFVSAIKATGRNVATGGRLGGQIVGSLFDGFRSLASEAFRVGANLAQSTVQGVASSLGLRTGSGTQGLLGFGGQVLGSAGRLFDAGLSGVGAIGRGLGTVAGIGLVGGAAVGGGLVAGGLMGKIATGGLSPLAGLGPLGGGLGGLTPSFALAGLTAVPGTAIIGALVATTVAVMAAKVVAGIADMGGKLLGVFGKMFGEIGGLAGNLVKTVAGIIDEARKAFSQYAESAIKMSGLSGLSLGASQSLLVSRGAFGMGAEQTGAAYSEFSRMPLFQTPLKRIWGVSGAIGSDEEFASTVEKAKQLPTMIRRIMMQSMPEGEGFWSRIISIPTEKIQSQMKFFQGFQLPSDQMKQQADDLFLLQNRWEGFYGFLMRTLGSALMPLITKGLSGITGFLKANQGNIAGWVQDIGKWFYVSLPTYIGKGLEMVLTLFKTMIEGIGGILRSLRHSVRPILEFIDALIAGVLGGFQNAIMAALRSVIFNGVKALLAQIIPAILMAIPGAGPLAAAAARKAIGTVGESSVQIPKLSENYDLQLKAAETLGGAENRWKQWTAPWVEEIDKHRNYAKILGANQGRREAEFNETFSNRQLLEQIATNTGATADGVQDTADSVENLAPHLAEVIVDGNVKREHRRLANKGR